MENADVSQLSTLPLVSVDKAYQYMLSLAYDNQEGIMFLESQLYNLLKEMPENADLLALLLHEQIMNNRSQRARSIAYKIWENGGEMQPDIEKMYIDDLMNLCLLDMAGAALAPAISDIENNVAYWGELLFKYAIISGNMQLLERLLAYQPDKRNFNILRDWVNLCADMKATAHMPHIMNRLCEKLQDMMLGFSFKLFFDRGFPEIMFVFYVNNEVDNLEDLRNMLNMQISTYCAQRKLEDLINLSSVLYPIKNHPILNPDAEA